jgi:hypothetical protein
MKSCRCFNTSFVSTLIKSKDLFMKKEIYFFCLLIIGMGHVIAQAPTTPASNVTFSSLEGNGFRANWTSGNGTRRIVIMRQGSAVTAVPVDGVDYNPKSSFDSGDAIQPGQFVVYANSSSFVDVNGASGVCVVEVRVGNRVERTKISKMN